MSELSPKAQSLIRSGRTGLRPSDVDRERVLAALHARLGAAPLPPDAGTPLLAAATPRALWPFVSAALIGAGLIGGILAFALRSRPEATAALQLQPAPSASAAHGTPPGAATTPAASARLAAQSSAGASASPASSATEAPARLAPLPAPIVPSGAPSLSARREPDRLAEEVAVLSRAATHLRAGRAAEALKALEEHQHRFPKGALTAERRAAKAEALCAMGRFTEAQSELTRLFRSSPQSPHGVRARELCRSRSAKFQ